MNRVRMLRLAQSCRTAVTEESWGRDMKRVFDDARKLADYNDFDDPQLVAAAKDLLDQERRLPGTSSQGKVKALKLMRSKISEHSQAAQTILKKTEILDERLEHAIKLMEYDIMNPQESRTRVEWGGRRSSKQDKPKWMKAFSDAVADKNHALTQRRDFWDTAQYFFNQGMDPHAAATKMLAGA